MEKEEQRSETRRTENDASSGVSSRMIFVYIECYNGARLSIAGNRPMAINLAHRPDLDSRVEQLADRLGLKGRGRRTATIERALTLLKKHGA